MSRGLKPGKQGRAGGHSHGKGKLAQPPRPESQNVPRFLGLGRRTFIYDHIDMMIALHLL